jgi:phosphoglycolate phosphatase-like HAD superfamily hydrolase
MGGIMNLIRRQTQSGLKFLLTGFVAIFAVCICSVANAADPLASWNEGPAKKAILEFVAAVTDENGKDYVKPTDRIATFDNDGTLWVEYPMYTQVLFAFERIKMLAPQHPEWKTTQPFKALLEGDMKTVGASGMKGLMEILIASHTGMTAAEFDQEVSTWLATSRQSKFDRLYTELVYQPQLELLAYLRANGFKTFIVSGGGIAFMRPISEKTYGIPPEQVVGSSVVAEFRVKDGKPALVRMPKIDFINDKAGKPVGIYEHIGRRPILAFGNSDSDIQMIEYTMAGEGRRLGLFVHHTDADREYAYDRTSHVGTLDKALDQASANGWIIVDMKLDWQTVFPPE